MERMQYEQQQRDGGAPGLKLCLWAALADAAARAGMAKVIIPEENRKDLFEVPAEVRDTLRIVFARDAMRVLAEALTRMPGGEEACAEVLPLHVPAHGRPGAIQ